MNIANNNTSNVIFIKSNQTLGHADDLINIMLIGCSKLVVEESFLDHFKFIAARKFTYLSS